MLTAKQVKEIREHLEKAQNPLFFFDNDPDGLCSFLLLQRYLGKGKGVPIKSFPELSDAYFRKIQELNADYVFILDKPVVSESFFKKIEEVNIPIVWIDHHEVDVKEIPKYVNYYNPLYNKEKTNEPVTALCYQVNPDDKLAWIAVVGCVSDKYFPKFYADFKKIYPELAITSKDAFDILYNSPIGKIGRIFNFALKDRTTDVINMIRFLMKAKSPYEVLEESNRNRSMHARFNQIDSKYRKLLNKAVGLGNSLGEVLFFQFGGELSISSDLANELSYRFPDKLIFVAYLKGTYANISGRGKGVRDKVLKVIGGLEDATGGGHEEAVGARIRVEDLEKFRKGIEKLI